MLFFAPACAKTHMHTANISIACEKPHSYHAMNARRTACRADTTATGRSEEHTSELQSRLHLVCRLLLEKKKNDRNLTRRTHVLQMGHEHRDLCTVALCERRL